jgi:glutathione S-transferase
LAVVLVHLVIVLALLEFFAFIFAVARARERFGVHAPATAGHPEFERYFRVQMNTLEQLVVFVPSILLFGHYLLPWLAALIGLVFVIGRWLYFRGYVRDPKARSLGFLLSGPANLILLVGALVGIIRALIIYPHLA